MDLAGRDRAQNKTLTREPARAWGGVDPLAKIASASVITEAAVCPSCHIISRLVHVSERDSLLATEASLIPALAVGNLLRKAQCVLCTAAEIPSIRAQEAAAGHIWFLIGDMVNAIQSQAALNQHFWAAINNTSQRQRKAARDQLLELVAESAFGGLQLPHLVISQEERGWLESEMRRTLGDDASSILGEEAIRAFIDQSGVPLLITKRIPRPEWASHVRFIPTPAGIEAYRTLYILPDGTPPETLPTQHRR